MIVCLVNAGGIGRRGDFLVCWRCVVTGVVFCIGRVGCFLVICSLVAVRLLGVCRTFDFLSFRNGMHFLSLGTGMCDVLFVEQLVCPYCAYFW